MKPPALPWTEHTARDSHGMLRPCWTVTTSVGSYLVEYNAGWRCYRAYHNNRPTTYTAKESDAVKTMVERAVYSQTGGSS